MIRSKQIWLDIGENFPDVVFNEWLKLYHYFEHELLEGEITNETYEAMSDALMAIKSYLPEKLMEVSDARD